LVIFYEDELLPFLSKMSSYVVDIFFGNEAEMDGLDIVESRKECPRKVEPRWWKKVDDEDKNYMSGGQKYLPA
jgi:hypothetical protein